MRTDDSCSSRTSVRRSLRGREEMALLQPHAGRDEPLLIVGASGADWTAAARALHYQGPRQGRAFVPVDCAALTAPGSALAGLLRLATGGTLFLNQVHALSPDGPDAWPRLLLDACTAAKAAGVRIVAATGSARPAPDLPGVLRVDMAPLRGAGDLAAVGPPQPTCGLVTCN